MTDGMTSDDPAFDGTAHYRTDRFGARIVVLPATCRHGHNLAACGYRAREGNGVLRVRCNLCAGTGQPDAYWTLRTTGEVTNRAEMDNAPYPELVPPPVTIQTTVVQTFTGMEVRWYINNNASRVMATATQSEVSWENDAPESLRLVARLTHEMMQNGEYAMVRQMATDRLMDGRLIGRGRA
jgi:hypothetical protein